VVRSMRRRVPIPFGVADVKRRGDDITVVATSSMVHVALEAAERLAGEGISLEVIDPRTVAPLDRSTIGDSVSRTGRAIVIDEGHRSFGVVRRSQPRSVSSPSTSLRPRSPGSVLLTFPSRSLPDPRGGDDPQRRRRHRRSTRSPAMIEVRLPREGSTTMAAGVVLEWFVEEGDVVAEGQIVAEIETDKVSFEIAAPGVRDRPAAVRRGRCRGRGRRRPAAHRRPG
jgi:hypothetical protein